MSVIFRRVTNGFRSEWGRDLLAAVRSVVNTGKRQGLTAGVAELRYEYPRDRNIVKF